MEVAEYSEVLNIPNDFRNQIFVKGTQTLYRTQKELKTTSGMMRIYI